MNEPFADLKAIKAIRAKRKLSKVNIRLPEKVVSWVQRIHRQNGIPLEAVYASLLIAGIAQFVKDKPLERVS